MSLYAQMTILGGILPYMLASFNPFLFWWAL